MKVLLHGFTGGPSSWDRVVARLSSEPLRLTLPGHLGTAGDVGFDDVSQLVLQDAQAEAVELVGYSLGARVALVTALVNPERVRRLVLVGVNPGLREPSARDARRAADARWIELLRQEGLEAFVQRWRQLPLWDTQAALGPEILDSQHKLRMRHHPAGLADCLTHLGLSAMPDCWPRLSRLSMPVTLVVGALDAKFGRIAGQMAALVPRVEVVTVPECGHNVLLERPEAVAATLA